eukprot:7891759-Prorocentrum_lima.AAC.1
MTSSLVGSEMCIRDRKKKKAPTKKKGAQSLPTAPRDTEALCRTLGSKVAKGKRGCLLYTSPSPRDSTSS